MVVTNLLLHLTPTPGAGNEVSPRSGSSQPREGRLLHPSCALMQEGLGTKVEQSGTAALPRASRKSPGGLWLWMSLEG